MNALLYELHRLNKRLLCLCALPSVHIKHLLGHYLEWRGSQLANYLTQITQRFVEHLALYIDQVQRTLPHEVSSNKLHRSLKLTQTRNIMGTTGTKKYFVIK